MRNGSDYLFNGYGEFLWDDEKILKIRTGGCTALC
jgi:hypothetical protein